MLAIERKNKILHLISQNRVVSVAELSEYCEAHETTIRRDLDVLEKKGLVTRIHGGVMASVEKKSESPVSKRFSEYLEEKQRIARAAIEYIEDGENIILDSGTTTLQIAENLGTYTNLTVVTNDIKVADVLKAKEGIKTIVTGGTLYPNTYILNGMITDHTLASISVNKAFLATPAINMQTGLNHFDETLVPAKLNMINSAEKLIVVADHSKIGQKALHAFCPLNTIDSLITGKECDQVYLEQLESQISHVATV